MFTALFTTDDRGGRRTNDVRSYTFTVVQIYIYFFFISEKTVYEFEGGATQRDGAPPPPFSRRISVPPQLRVSKNHGVQHTIICILWSLIFGGKLSRPSRYLTYFGFKTKITKKCNFLTKNYFCFYCHYQNIMVQCPRRKIRNDSFVPYYWIICLVSSLI